MGGTRNLQRVVLVGLVLVAVALVGFGLLSWGGRSDATLPGAAKDSPGASSTPGNSAGSSSSSDGVALSALPSEARTTVQRIRAGGPFPYSRDGIVFQNREGLLAAEPTGYYHEYTVPTPGSSDRGARRIVTGADGTLYYSGDHYRSFQQITGVS